MANQRIVLKQIQLVQKSHTRPFGSDYSFESLVD